MTSTEPSSSNNNALPKIFMAAARDDESKLSHQNQHQPPEPQQGSQRSDELTDEEIQRIWQLDRTGYRDLSSISPLSPLYSPRLYSQPNPDPNTNLYLYQPLNCPPISTVPMNQQYPPPGNHHQFDTTTNLLSTSAKAGNNAESFAAASASFYQHLGGSIDEESSGGIPLIHQTNRRRNQSIPTHLSSSTTINTVPAAAAAVGSSLWMMNRNCKSCTNLADGDNDTSRRPYTTNLNFFESSNISGSGYHHHFLTADKSANEAMMNPSSASNPSWRFEPPPPPHLNTAGHKLATLTSQPHQSTSRMTAEGFSADAAAEAAEAAAARKTYAQAIQNLVDDVNEENESKPYLAATACVMKIPQNEHYSSYNQHQQSTSRFQNIKSPNISTTRKNNNNNNVISENLIGGDENLIIHNHSGSATEAVGDNEDETALIVKYEEAYLDLVRQVRKCAFSDRTPQSLAFNILHVYLRQRPYAHSQLLTEATAAKSNQEQTESAGCESFPSMSTAALKEMLIEAKNGECRRLMQPKDLETDREYKSRQIDQLLLSPENLARLAFIHGGNKNMELHKRLAAEEHAAKILVPEDNAEFSLLTRPEVIHETHTLAEIYQQQSEMNITRLKAEQSCDVRNHQSCEERKNPENHPGPSSSLNLGHQIQQQPLDKATGGSELSLSRIVSSFNQQTNMNNNDSSNNRFNDSFASGIATAAVALALDTDKAEDSGISSDVAQVECELMRKRLTALKNLPNEQSLLVSEGSLKLPKPSNENEFLLGSSHFGGRVTVGLILNGQMPKLKRSVTPMKPNGEQQTGKTAKERFVAVRQVVRGETSDFCIRRLQDFTRYDRGSPHLLHYHQFVQEEKLWYLARDVCDHNLDTFLEELKKQGCRDFEETIKPLLHHMALGLAFLHSKVPTLFHGNLKPTNLLIDSKRVLRLTDFGFGKLCTLRHHYSGPVREFNGTLHPLCWKPPEFYCVEKSYSSQSDVHSAAMLAYYMMTAGSKHPFIPNLSGNARAKDLQERLLNERYDLVNISHEAEDLLHDMLPVRQEDRIGTRRILEHPFFWPLDRRADFLSAVAVDLHPLMMQLQNGGSMNMSSKNDKNANDLNEMEFGKLLMKALDIPVKNMPSGNLGDVLPNTILHFDMTNMSAGGGHPSSHSAGSTVIQVNTLAELVCSMRLFKSNDKFNSVPKLIMLRLPDLLMQVYNGILSVLKNPIFLTKNDSFPKFRRNQLQQKSTAAEGHEINSITVAATESDGVIDIFDEDQIVVENNNGTRKYNQQRMIGLMSQSGLRQYFPFDYYS